jgi:maleate isomerase
VLAALAALGTTRVGFASPFPEELGQASLRYLEANGIAVLGTRFGGYRDNFSIAEIPHEEVIELACGADHPDAQVVLMPGGNMPCLAVADAIEARLGKPVISTNQAGMWLLLERLGLPDRIAGAGKLLRERPSERRLGL